ncbi:HNH endonuclease [Mobiluncus mulieris]
MSRGGNHNFDNLMALCKPCHSRISALDGDRWRSGRFTKRDVYEF